MGVAIGDLINKKPAKLDDFSKRIVAIDAFNMIYQFITILRGPDGSLLMDRNGNVTSHISGMLSRCLVLMEKDIKLAFVFDGKAPELKMKERERRHKLKVEAQELYEKAVEEENIELMQKYATRTAVITDDIINDAKKLLDILGIPFINAPSEAEAQASYMLDKGDVDFVATQDYDALLFGAKRIIRNLAVSPRRKVKGIHRYEKVEPEIIYLNDVLKNLNITKEQLIVLGILVGTDFNVGGVKGIGPKKGLKLVKEYKDNFDKLFNDIGWEFDYSWKDVFDLFINMPKTDNYELKWNNINNDELKAFLKSRDFSDERISKTIEKIKGIKEIKKQRGLGDFF